VKVETKTFPRPSCEIDLELDKQEIATSPWESKERKERCRNVSRQGLSRSLTINDQNGGSVLPPVLRKYRRRKS